MQTLTGAGKGLPVTGLTIAGVIMAVWMFGLLDAANETLDAATIATEKIIDTNLDAIFLSLVVTCFVTKSV